MKKVLIIIFPTLVLFFGLACIPRNIENYTFIESENAPTIIKGKAIEIPLIATIQLGHWKSEAHGRIQKEMMYDFGRVKWAKEYFPNGSLAQESFYEKGGKIGRITYFYESKNPKWKKIWNYNDINQVLEFEEFYYLDDEGLVFHRTHDSVLSNRLSDFKLDAWNPELTEEERSKCPPIPEKYGGNVIIPETPTRSIDSLIEEFRNKPHSPNGFIEILRKHNKS